MRNGAVVCDCELKINRVLAKKCQIILKWLLSRLKNDIYHKHKPFTLTKFFFSSGIFLKYCCDRNILFLLI